MSADNHGEQPPTISSLLTYKTPRPPCCVTRLGEDPPVFAVGMYELVSSAPEPDTNVSQTSSDQQTQQRTGCIDILRVEGTAEAPKLQRLSHIDVPFGILDLILCPQDAAPFLFSKASDAAYTLAAATSVGSIAVFKVSTDFNKWTTRLLQVAAKNEVITQLCWHPTKRNAIGFGTATGKVQVMVLPEKSQSDGEGGNDNVPWLKIMNSSDESLEIQMQSGVLTMFEHSLEAWVLAFPDASRFANSDGPSRPAYALDGLGQWSGSDDAVIAWSHLHDNQQHGGLPMPPAWTDRKIHGAGVTAILPVFLQDVGRTVLITGSYDDRIRVLGVADASAPTQRPKVLAEMNLGGGVWCFKVLSFSTPGSRKDSRYVVRLLVCCMYAGARMVELAGTNAESEWMVNVVAKFTEHESMCYGGDSWVVNRKDDDGPASSSMMATCSFYDKRVCLWRLDGS